MAELRRNWQSHEERELVKLTMDSKFKFSILETWTYSNSSISDDIPGTIFSESCSKKDKKRSLITKTDNTISWIKISSASVWVQAYSWSLTKAEEYIAEIKEVYKPFMAEEANKISVNFWNLTNNGPESRDRVIVAPAWENIQNNYGKEIRQKLATMMTDFKPTHGGQIILWHGAPGTGKTYALRALCRAWKSWASAEYILDPEHLFGDSAQYLASMLFTGGESYYDENLGDFVEAQDEEKWKLLILEDTGELVSQNAKERSGQGLSRLLNLADGFIGQGLKVIVIITTNEEVGKLHPAVSRPGRTAGIVAFKPLTVDEANVWLLQNGKDNGEVTKDTPLADLYAKLAKSDLVTDMYTVKKLGFGARNAVQNRS